MAAKRSFLSPSHFRVGRIAHGDRSPDASAAPVNDCNVDNENKTPKSPPHHVSVVDALLSHPLEHSAEFNTFIPRMNTYACIYISADTWNGQKCVSRTDTVGMPYNIPFQKTRPQTREPPRPTRPRVLVFRPAVLGLHVTDQRNYGKSRRRRQCPGTDFRKSPFLAFCCSRRDKDAVSSTPLA